MLRSTCTALKKKFTVHPAIGPGARKGGKNLAWKPKISDAKLHQFNWAFQLEFPRRHPSAWNAGECSRLGLQAWPKEVGFFNAGDNFELTPEMHVRLCRKFHDHEHWTAEHNERVVISLFPLCEANPKDGLAKVAEVFQRHVTRFGADHVIYNAVMQARAFAKDFEGAKMLFKEMAKKMGLEPNAQSFVNMMLAARLAGKPKTVAEEYFQQAIASKALTAVVRLDTEFEMWWSQLERMGSFAAAEGYLSNKEEGAVPLPRDPYAIWGWDRSERKFVTPKEAVAAEVQRRTRSGGMTGNVFNAVLREPWFKYRGFKPHDWAGPNVPEEYRNVNRDAPANTFNPYNRRRPASTTK